MTLRCVFVILALLSLPVGAQSFPTRPITLVVPFSPGAANDVLAQKSALLPDAPPIAEAVPGYEVDVWQGLLAPKGTPAPVIEKLNAEFNRALKISAVREKLAAQGIDTAGIKPD